MPDNDQHPEPAPPTRADIEAASRQAQLRQAGMAIVAVVAIVIAVVVGIRQQTTDAALEQARQQGQQRAAAISSLRSGQGALATALDRQRHQFQRCKHHRQRRTPRACRTPVAPPATQIAESPRIVGPSDAEVAEAVDAYCRAHSCRGARGKRGAKGDPPTPAQVASAVAMFCDANGDCQGPPGPQGDPPTAEAVAAAVAAYCAAHEQCEGAAGASGQPGKDGAAGKDGRGITGVTCGDDDQFHVHYSDGTSDAVGRCRPKTATETTTTTATVTEPPPLIPS